jgi:UDP-N-acetylmuramate: L-alanyl-gamma-D-glutamyl-meso-diaminopimelate ligase
MRIYFMGICGTAMGQAALLARDLGHDVAGSDAGVYPPMSEVLAAAGIAVWAGYDPARLAAWAPDVVVVGNAQSRGNPEVEWLLDTRACRFTSLPALLAETVLAGRRPLVIAGTHGKTTTTALTAFLLREQGRDPGYLIGGVPLDPPNGSHLGRAEDPFVIEGDEYDSAFFDKRSKFIHYAPHIVGLNNLEFDHADIFRDLADVQRTFSHLLRLVPRGGAVVMNGDDPGLAALGEPTWTRVVRVGTGAGNDTRIEDFVEDTEGARFRLSWRGRTWAEVRWTHPGEFNARNAALAATVAGLALHPDDPIQLDLGALARFRGVRRRQQVLLATPSLTVIEDFGHHPTAVGATLRALRARHPGAELIAAFEPRSNTARTRVLQEGFIVALGAADAVWLGAVSRAERLAAAERFDPAAVIAALAARGVAGRTAADNATLGQALRAHVMDGPRERRRVVVFFTNGSFDGIIGDFVAAMAAAAAGAAAEP